MFLRIDGRTSGSSPRCSSRRLPLEEHPDHEQPAEDQPQRRREAEQLRRVRLRRHPAPHARAQHAEDGEPRPAADSTTPTRSILRRARPRGSSAIRRVSTRIAEHDQHLAGEHPAPAQVGREQPADERADGDGDRARRHHQPVRARPALGAEVGRHERDDRGQDQRRADPLEERPADQQDRQRRRDRGGERARAVDHAADRERPLAADQGADLAAGDHQRRHHQRVEGDRGLDPGDVRPDVLGDGRDRDVHHRRVERHQELAGGQGEQDQGGSGLGSCSRPTGYASAPCSG